MVAIPVSPPSRESSPSSRGWSPRRSPLLKAAGSLKGGVVLMVLIGVAMAIATIYEARRGRVAAQILFYQAWWFQFLLVCLALNIFAATLLRWPFTLRKIGFPITHVGILVILGGALLTSRFGIDAQLRLAEQSASDRLTTPALVLAIEPVSGGESAYEIPLPMSPERPSRGLDQRVSLRDWGVDVVYRAFLPNSRWIARFEPADTGPAAAELLVDVAEGHDVMSFWLTSGGAPMTIGPLRVELLDADDSTAVEALLAEDDREGTLRLRWSGGERRVDVSQARREPVELGDGRSLRVLAYYPDAMVASGGGLTKRSDAPTNPAIEFELRDERTVDRRVAFAKFPQFTQTADQSGGLGEIEAVYSFSAAGDGPALRLVRAGDALHFRARSADGRRARGRVALGERVATDILAMPIRVGRCFARARPVNEPEPLAYDPQRGGDPALLVALAADGAEAVRWIGWQRPVSAMLGPRAYRLSLKHREHRLPFQVRLDRFVRETYPGTDQAAMFTSHVTIIEDGNQPPVAAVITMNRPLKYGGYTFYQSGFEQGERRNVSVLSVSRDPGKWAVYAGFALVCSGVVLMALAKRASRPAKDPLAQAARTPTTGTPSLKEQLPCVT